MTRAELNVLKYNQLPTPFIYGQVTRFWDKAGRVLAYKRQTAVEAAKREALDRQLDFLVGQTQRYSSLLAKKLAADAEKDRAAAAAAATKVGGGRYDDIVSPRVWP